ncbi:ribonuclease H family protein [Schnuerera sp. xch1]|uniref:ribonuclease H1 domain-containing protein n=1 Tax=Schnuerera sp. xch1 TaxID=2874283 RepID=UPI001CBE01BA|nr:ribonuclease H family protein [Schnuerera sp. xch1]MBZ2174615.1 ribonuclease H family protein [Schnuerera sp. xch1]
MAKHYYAVKEGKEIGIYNTWTECELQVKGYSGAIYKKFSTYEEALNFINNDEKAIEEKDLQRLKENEMIAYVDGSFDKDNRYYSYGAVLFTKEGKQTLSDKYNDEKMVDMRNVAGEIKGSMVAMQKALENEKDTLYLYYDYVGIEKWAIGEWKTNKYGTKMYKRYYDSVKDKLKIMFLKVKAHTGVEYNEEADLLAKKALGIEV